MTYSPTTLRVLIGSQRSATLTQALAAAQAERDAARDLCRDKDAAIRSLIIQRNSLDARVLALERELRRYQPIRHWWRR